MMESRSYSSILYVPIMLSDETLYQVQSIEQKDTAGTQSHSGGGTSVTSSDEIKPLVFLGTTSSR